MCLVVQRNEKFQKAEQDIIVYKVLRRGKRFFGLFNCWRTPFQGTVVDCHLGKPTELNARGQIDNKILEGSGFEFFTVESGVIHTFLHKEDCRWAINDDKKDIMFKCIVPKGTEYIKGRSNGVYASIGAKKIVFVEEIK